MFERRLKILLTILAVMTATLALRAAQIQILERAHWTDQAERTMRREQYVETTRGRILDYKGREIAIDHACMDACVLYPVITFPPDPDWVRRHALWRVRRQHGSGWSRLDVPTRRALWDQEIQLVLEDIERMWDSLAEVSGQPRAAIDEVRQAIVRRVEMRKQYLWHRRYEAALAEHENRPPMPWWQRWLLDESSSVPRLEQFKITVAEESEPHVILRGISPAVTNQLGRDLDRYPGLVLRPGMTRYYPYGEVGAHLLGRLSRVNREDLTRNAHLDDLRKYWPNDLIGRGGLEELLEDHLRGTRGRVERRSDNNREVERVDPQPGRDVRITVDFELQAQIQDMFKRVPMRNPDGSIDLVAMHGAAVVIDVRTGQVRAMVSSPTFDPNRFDELYARMAEDELNKPLLNRATQYPLVPGSIIKPLVGLGAITQGLVDHDHRIECRGYLVINGRTYTRVGRCWTMSMFNTTHAAGSDPHPDCWLDLTDALERSCNVYFETLGHQLKLEGLTYWFDKFGLGRPTGVGIAESSGRLPTSYQGPNRAHSSWLASIGQGPVSTTAIQMANVAATIARDGVWVQPTLVAPQEGVSFPQQRVDLKLSSAALRKTREGLIRVINKRGGTAYHSGVRREDILVAGKTGSAQAAPTFVTVRDAQGNPVLDTNGRPMRRPLQPSNNVRPNPEAPWYRDTGKTKTELTHAWFIGYAPAENPTLAWAVMVEYGGSGGGPAAAIGKAILDAAIEHGYLHRGSTLAMGNQELMYDE